MIKKAQIKFICIIMSILFAIFAIIFGAIYILSQNLTERRTEEIIENTLYTFTGSKNNTVSPNGLIVILDANGHPVQFFFDEKIFNEQSALQISDYVLGHPYNYGQINTVVYKVKTVDRNKIIVACDISQSLVTLKSNATNSLIILTIIYFILFFIVSMLSFSIFQPIKDTFEKQKRFISDASHELKTPLTVISANVDVLKQENKDNQWLNNIKSQTERLDGLIADMLALAKTDENKVILKNERFNASQEILNDVLPFDAVAFEKKKTLETEIEPNVFIQGDKQSLKKITTILIDNAIKYSSDNGQIIVKLHKSGNKAVFSVWNTGSTVQDSESSRIFERFYRSENSRSRESGGSGLGLSIAKNLADKNKWKIFAESSFNEYMKITLIMQEKHR